MSSKMVLIVAIAAVPGCSLFATMQVPVRNEGDVLVNTHGMMLYTFDRDGQAKSTCTGQCAANWPPLVAAADAKSAGDYSIVTRDDGRRQWAYKGQPLYLSVKDQNPGDRAGQGFNNLWRVARP